MSRFFFIVISLLHFNILLKAQSKRETLIIKEITKKDINKDKVFDYILVEEDLCSGYSYNYDDLMRCRTIFVIIKGKDEHNIFSTSNSKIIPCSNCNEDRTDPFKDIKVHNDGFSIVLAYQLVPEGTKIDEIISFRYDKIVNNFLLSKKIRTIYSYKNGELQRNRTIETEKDFGKIYFSDYR